MSKENLIDDFVGGLDFDPLVILANILDVTVDPPPLGDMWPDWQGELVEDVCKAMGEVIEPITEHPDVQRLIGQVETLSQEIKAIKKQYAKDLVAINTFYYPKPVCENQPPEITNGYNACLSCPMRKTCLLIFKEK